MRPSIELRREPLPALAGLEAEWHAFGRLARRVKEAGLRDDEPR